MKRQYRFKELSQSEREYHEMILMEEIEVQAWYAVTFSDVLNEEVFIAIQ